MYAMGSLNCSGVGRKVGQSERPNGRSEGFEAVFLGFGVLTEFMSRDDGTRRGGPWCNWIRIPISS